MGEKTFRYLALGDSYTIGEKVSPHQRWPVLLVKRLKSKGIAISDPMIIAKTGWTSSDLLNALDKTEIKGFFDLVTLLIGVNNQYQNIDLMVYRKEFSQLLNKAIYFTKSAPKQVFVLSIPDWSATPFASNRERRQIKTQLDHFNRVNRLETQLSQAHYFDITTISSQAGMDPTFLSKDELHPSEKMYIRWVDLIFPTAYQTLYQVKEETHGNTLHN